VAVLVGWIGIERDQQKANQANLLQAACPARNQSQGSGEKDKQIIQWETGGKGRTLHAFPFEPNVRVCLCARLPAANSALKATTLRKTTLFALGLVSWISALWCQAPNVSRAE